jgi:hypothetical protein
MSAIGASVFIIGLLHSSPLTTIGVEYGAIYGTYFGVHVYSSNAVSKQGLNTTK